MNAYPRTRRYDILDDRGMSKEIGTVRQVETSAPRLALLIARRAGGEQEALASLYDETSASINGLLVRMLQHPRDAEEALLDVYMTAWRNARTYTTDRGTVQS